MKNFKCCPQNWKSWEQSCYLFLGNYINPDSRFNKGQAVNHCKTKHPKANLPNISNREENLFIKLQSIRNDIKTFWVGLFRRNPGNDTDQLMNWAWENEKGEKLSFLEGWARAEPDKNLTRKCVVADYKGLTLNTINAMETVLDGETMIVC